LDAGADAPLQAPLSNKGNPRAQLRHPPKRHILQWVLRSTPLGPGPVPLRLTLRPGNASYDL